MEEIETQASSVTCPASNISKNDKKQLMQNCNVSKGSWAGSIASHLWGTGFQGDFVFHTLSCSRCQRPSRCAGKVFPQVAIHGAPNDVQVADMCSSHQTDSSLSAHCAGRSYGVPCWTCLEAQLESLMRHKHHSCKQSRQDEGACLVPRHGGYRQWTSHRMPHRRWRPLEVASSPFGMALPGMVFLSGMPLTSNPSSTTISLFHLRTFILD